MIGQSQQSRAAVTAPAVQRSTRRAPNAMEEMLNQSAPVQQLMRTSAALNRGAWQRMKIDGKDVPRSTPAPDDVDARIWQNWLADPQLEFTSQEEAELFGKLATEAPHKDMTELAELIHQTVGSEGSIDYQKQAQEAAAKPSSLTGFGMTAHDSAVRDMIRKGYLRDVEQVFDSFSGKKSFRRADVVAKIGGQTLFIESKNLRAQSEAANSPEQAAEFTTQLDDYLAWVSISGGQQQYRFAHGIPPWAYKIMQQKLGLYIELRSNLSAFSPGTPGRATVSIWPKNAEPVGTTTPVPRYSSSSSSNNNNNNNYTPSPAPVPLSSPVSTMKPPSYSAPSFSSQPPPSYLASTPSSSSPRKRVERPAPSPMPPPSLTSLRSTPGSSRAKAMVAAALQSGKSTVPRPQSNAEVLALLESSHERKRKRGPEDEPPAVPTSTTSDDAQPLLQLPPPQPAPPPIPLSIPGIVPVSLPPSPMPAPQLSMPQTSMPLSLAPPVTTASIEAPSEPLFEPPNREDLLNELASLYDDGLGEFGWHDDEKKRDAHATERELRMLFNMTSEEIGSELKARRRQ